MIDTNGEYDTTLYAGFDATTATEIATDNLVDEGLISRAEQERLIRRSEYYNCDSISEYMDMVEGDRTGAKNVGIFEAAVEAHIETDCSEAESLGDVFDDTRYADFDPESFAYVEGHFFLEEGELTEADVERICTYYSESDARSFAEMADDFPTDRYGIEFAHRFMGTVVDTYRDELEYPIGEADADADADRDRSFEVAVLSELANRENMKAIVAAIQRASDPAERGPVEIANTPDPDDPAEVRRVADALEEQSRGVDVSGFTGETERSFELAVINQLLAEGDAAVAQYAIEHALDRHALGPVEIANYARIRADADDSEAVGLVVDYLQQGYRDDRENGYDVSTSETR